MPVTADDKIKSMDLADAEALLGTVVYQATQLIEQLADAGKCSGNGHHARQKITDYAIAELRGRWTED
jgi:hypothetical protein